MSVEKYKPKETPRTLEMELEAIFRRSQQLIHSAKDVIEESRKLIEPGTKAS